ncbi:hypothetical protein H5410_015915 [Solanum commersonii]|uniref:Uncharacterized protein n=1 Tax=Solanum commersonii TaxID=4109 RepID=A0A9J5ZVH7_SOLCO|nr:hypothetical protein H5410_015915 [Solanum commersonii]
MTSKSNSDDSIISERMISYGNFDCAVEFGMSNLVWLHISFACTRFRTRLEHPVEVFSCWKN